MLTHHRCVQPLLAAALAHSPAIKLSALEPQQLAKPTAYESVLEAASEEEITGEGREPVCKSNSMFASSTPTMRESVKGEKLQ